VSGAGKAIYHKPHGKATTARPAMGFQIYVASRNCDVSGLPGVPPRNGLQRLGTGRLAAR